jgi:uncharacterized protein (DUF983 family)
MAEAESSLGFIWRSLACRCPRCGKGDVYDGFLKFTERCSSCGLPIAKNDNGDGPAVFLIFILGFALVPLALLIAMNVDWPLWLHGLIWGVVVTGLTVGLLRPAKALTLALQYRHRKEVFDEKP